MTAKWEKGKQFYVFLCYVTGAQRMRLWAVEHDNIFGNSGESRKVLRKYALPK